MFLLCFFLIKFEIYSPKNNSIPADSSEVKSTVPFMYWSYLLFPEIMILSKGYNIWPTGNVMPTPSFYGACLDDDIIMLSLGKQTYVHQAGSLFHSKTLVCLHGSQDFVCPQGSFLSPGSIFKGKWWLLWSVD